MDIIGRTVVSKNKNEYYVIKQIGGGNYGKVYLAHDCKSKKEVALKQQTFESMARQPEAIQLFKNEGQLMKKINDDHVVKLIEYFGDKHSQYIIMEYCSLGTVSKFLENQEGRRLKEEKAIPYFKQLLQAFTGIHSKGILHRDIKLDNILISSDLKWKVADFGFGKQLIGDRMTQTILGSWWNMAPEILMGQNYNYKVDVYSLGVVFYHILVGDFPYKNKVSFEEQAKMIQNVPLHFPKDIRLSNDMKQLLSGMLRFSSQQRITMKQILDHQMFKENENINSIPSLLGSNIVLNSNLKCYEDNSFQFQNNKLDPEFNYSFDQQPAIQVQVDISVNNYKENVEKQKNDQKIKEQYANAFLNYRSMYMQIDKFASECLLLSNEPDYLMVFIARKKVYCMMEFLKNFEGKERFSKYEFDLFKSSPWYKDIKKILEKNSIRIQELYSNQKKQISEIYNMMGQEQSEILDNEIKFDKEEQQMCQGFKDKLFAYFDLLSKKWNFNNLEQSQFQHLLRLLDIIISDIPSPQQLRNDGSFKKIRLDHDSSKIDSTIIYEDRNDYADILQAHYKNARSI